MTFGRSWFVLIVTGLAALGCGAVDRPTAPEAHPGALTGTSFGGIIVPAYYYLDSSGDADWSTLTNTIAADLSKIGYVVVNEDSGPGAACCDADMKSRIAQVEAPGARYHVPAVAGYVSITDASGNQKSADDLLTEANEWWSWYNVRAIFFDNAYQPDATMVPVYEYLAQNLPTQLQLYPSFFNFGWGGTEMEEYVQCVSTAKFVGREAYAADYLNEGASWQPGGGFDWALQYNSAHFAHVLHDVDPATVSSLIATSHDRHAAYLFLTDRLESDHAYRGIPGSTTWDGEVTGQTSFSESYTNPTTSCPPPSPTP